MGEKGIRDGAAEGMKTGSGLGKVDTSGRRTCQRQICPRVGSWYMSYSLLPCDPSPAKGHAELLYSP